MADRKLFKGDISEDNNVHKLEEAVYIGGKLKRAVVYMYDAETGISRLKVVNPIGVKLAPCLVCTCNALVREHLHLELVHQ